MSQQPGYQEDGEKLWWWKVAYHLDEAAKTAINAMAHNLDSQTQTFAAQDKIAEAQKIVLEIFQAKGFVPTTDPPKAE